MRGRIILTLAAGTGLWLGGSVHASEPIKSLFGAKTEKTTSAPDSQVVADEIARRIKASGTAEGATVNIRVEKGRVELTGSALSMDQQQAIAKNAMGVDGVSEVVLNMKVITKLETSAPPMNLQLARMQTQEPGQIALQPPATPAPMPMATVGVPAGAPYGNDPVPLVGPGAGGYDPYGPKMPGYSWPTYAPYNNVSRVAYPQAYPYNAFPFIGPYYPFPKVPPGWRTVQLSWDDGHWYMGRVSTPHDYWRVRFW
ncbi:BON domain-containing protein [Telmatocola sphagniphila]|uniref:BON domain-containing protein n=1 Tax=Telmatocola sphagniphila TaxID=1123043 RepID=A0A8E6EU58_9BACT|nr:BON domain-containing protein [Telmatocola sphagniphila]QVL33304.1 BON domain-containing protein [Telmatocola sphagniphila]